MFYFSKNAIRIWILDLFICLNRFSVWKYYALFFLFGQKTRKKFIKLEKNWSCDYDGLDIRWILITWQIFCQTHFPLFWIFFKSSLFSHFEHLHSYNFGCQEPNSPLLKTIPVQCFRSLQSAISVLLIFFPRMSGWRL